MPELLLVNGPNLGRLGRRKPEIYGHCTLADIEGRVRALASAHGYSLIPFQSDAEADLIGFLADHHGADGAIVNPGALMMAGWSLRDALEDFPAPWIEVHITNLWARESFRHNSVLTPLAAGIICGLGTQGYVLAAQALIDIRARRG